VCQEVRILDAYPFPCPLALPCYRMPLGRRMPEEAKAWGNAQERLTSGRCCAGDRRE
jgi:hypothetical protein